MTPTGRVRMVRKGSNADMARRGGRPYDNLSRWVLMKGTMEKTPGSSAEIANGDHCLVTKGNHAGKSGEVHDLKCSKTGHLTITVQQANGEKFKTLARNVSKQA